MTRTRIAILLIALCSVSALAQTEIAPPADGSGNGDSNLVGESQLYRHGGPVMANAKVVYIFWGNVDPVYAKDLQYYRGVYGGMASHMAMLAQYGAPQGSLVGSQADVFDPTTPPVAIATRQAADEVRKWFAGRYDNNAIYTVILPPGHYLDLYADAPGFDTTCGSPNPTICSAHWVFHDSPGSGIYVKFSIIGYPDCSACRHSALDANGVLIAANDSQNAEIALIHATRGTMTNPLPDTGWLDSGTAGYFPLEGDEKCEAAVFRRIVPGGPYDTGSYYPIQVFFFQRTWSNLAGYCVE
jgi:hypothetical protein